MNKPQARKYFVRHPNRTLKYIVTWTKTRTHIAQSKDIRRGSQKQLPRHCLFSTARNILSNILHRGYSLPFVFTIFFFFYLLSIIFIQRREKKSNISLMTSPTMWKSWGNLHRLWCQNALFWTKRNNASVRLRLLLLLFGSFGLYERFIFSPWHRLSICREFKMHFILAICATLSPIFFERWIWLMLGDVSIHSILYILHFVNYLCVVNVVMGMCVLGIQWADWFTYAYVTRYPCNMRNTT